MIFHNGWLFTLYLRMYNCFKDTMLQLTPRQNYTLLFLLILSFIFQCILTFVIVGDTCVFGHFPTEKDIFLPENEVVYYCNTDTDPTMSILAMALPFIYITMMNLYFAWLFGSKLKKVRSLFCARRGYSYFLWTVQNASHRTFSSTETQTPEDLETPRDPTSTFCTLSLLLIFCVWTVQYTVHKKQN